MFFIAGISSKQQPLDFHQSMVCPHCGRYGQYEGYVQYMAFSLFFIPVLKWNKKYYVRSRCCGSLYSITNELGRSISNSEGVTIQDQDLRLLSPGSYSLTCPKCGYDIQKEYQYCPHCSTPLS